LFYRERDTPTANGAKRNSQPRITVYTDLVCTQKDYEMSRWSFIETNDTFFHILVRVEVLIFHDESFPDRFVVDSLSGEQPLYTSSSLDIVYGNDIRLKWATTRGSLPLYPSDTLFFS
jgi:hypothetical protein